MKKRVKTLKALIIFMSIIFMGFLSASAGPPLKPLPVLKPDLTVNLRIETRKWTRADNGATCYRLFPVFTIMNKGNAPAKGFKVKLERKIPENSKWEVLRNSDPLTFGPGEKKTFGPLGVGEYFFCGRDIPPYGQVGFRVTVDYENKVSESNEDNNTKTVMYRPLLKFKKITK